MKIKLWSIQDESGWNELQSKGILVGKEEFVDSDFKNAYDWMKVQMNKRIGLPKEKNQYPVWAWYQSINEKKKRPDLRESGYLPTGTIGYRIEIQKEQEGCLTIRF